MDEIKSRLMGKRLTTQEYFEKYELNSHCKIQSHKFFQALEDLDFALTNTEKAALEKMLDAKDSGSVDLGAIIRAEVTNGIRMVDLKPSEASSLQDLLSEMASFLHTEGMDLLQLMRCGDEKQKHSLDITVFNEILTDAGLGLNDNDLRLVKLRYDPEKKGCIYYDFFCDEIAASVVGSDQGIDSINGLIYTAIREHFNTFDAFFKRYDGAGRGFLKYDEWARFLGDYTIHTSSPVAKALLEALDPNSRK